MIVLVITINGINIVGAYGVPDVQITRIIEILLVGVGPKLV